MQLTLTRDEVDAVLSACRHERNAQVHRSITRRVTARQRAEAVRTMCRLDRVIDMIETARTPLVADRSRL